MSARNVTDHSSDSGLSEMTYCSGEMPTNNVFSDNTATFDKKLSSRAVVDITDVLKNEELVVEHNLKNKLFKFLITSAPQMESEMHKQHEPKPPSFLSQPAVLERSSFTDSRVTQEGEDYVSSTFDEEERNDDEGDDSENFTESVDTIQYDSNNCQPDSFLKDFLCLTVKSSGDNRTCLTSQPFPRLTSPTFSSSSLSPQRKTWNHTSVKLFTTLEIKSNNFIFKHAIFPQYSLLAKSEDSSLVRSKPSNAVQSWHDKPHQLRRKTSSSSLKEEEDLCSNIRNGEPCLKSESHPLTNVKQNYDLFYQCSDSELSSIASFNKEKVTCISPGKSMPHTFPKLSSEESSDEGSYKRIKKRKRKRRTCSDSNTARNDDSPKKSLTSVQFESPLTRKASNVSFTVSQEESQNLSSTCTGSPVVGLCCSRSSSVLSDTWSDLFSNSDDDSDSNKMQLELLESTLPTTNCGKDIFPVTSTNSNPNSVDVARPEAAVRDHFVFKKPIFVKPSQINQNLRADIDCFVQKKENQQGCIKSSCATKKDDDQLSIFIESDLTDFEIESDEEQRAHLSPTESIVNDWDNLSVYNNNDLSPPESHNISYSMRDHVQPRTMLPPKLIYIHPRKLLLKMCYFYNLCMDANCKKPHNLPENFRDMVLQSNYDQVKDLYNFICKNYRALAVVLPYIIEYLGMHQEKKLLAGLVRDMFIHYKLQKETLLQQILKVLIDLFKNDLDNTAKWFLDQYKDNIQLRIMVIEHIMSITISESNFFTKFWSMFRFLIEEYKELIPPNIVTKVLNRCLSVQKKDLPQCLLQVYDFLKQPLVKFNGFKHNPLLRRFIMDLYQLSAECARDIDKKCFEETGFRILPLDYLKNKPKLISSVNYGSTTSSAYENTRPANIDDADNSFENSLCDLEPRDVMKLSTCFINGNIIDLCGLLEKYKHAKYMNSLVAHTHIIYKKIEHQAFHNVLLQMLTKMRDTTDNEMVICTRHITINVLPLYDLAKDYKSAGLLILLFKDNLLPFTNSTIYWNKAPYLLNSFKSIPQKLVFIMKILTRGNCLDEAFDIIRLQEFELRNNKSSSLYTYKLSKVKEFLKLAATTKWKLFADVVYHFLSEESTMINNELDIPKRFDDFVICILKDYISKKNIEHLIQMQRLITKHHFYLKPNTLRAVLVVMSEQNINLRPFLEVFDYLCGMNIYCNQEENFNCIQLRSNMERDEIKMNLKFFFIRMLEKNIAPREIIFKIIESHHESELILPEILKPIEGTDVQNMQLRLVIAFMEFNPRIELLSQMYFPKITLSVDDVKKILQYYRRIM